MAARKRTRVVATEDTEEITTVRRRRRQVAVEESPTEEFPALSPAPGWHGVAQLTGATYRAQRELQQRRALEFAVIRATDDNTAETVRCMSRILRAGPGATLSEAMHGRYA